jgi:hypothetical protein
MLISIVIYNKELAMSKIMMSAAEISRSKRRLQILLNKMTSVGPLMRGSIVTNGKRHPQPYFSLNKNGRTYLIYLGDRRRKAAKKLSDNYKKAMRIIEEMTLINMNLLKNDAVEV